MKFKNNFFANVAFVSLGLVFGAGVLFAVNADNTQTYYLDQDGDGYGDSSISTTTALEPSGYVLAKDDCNDNNPSINPGEDELCDGIDNNCDGEIDEGAKTYFYFDGDDDNYGFSASSTLACVAPENYVVNSGDCNDSATSTNPGVVELCDGVDNNCNGETDEGVKTTYYLDRDDDSYGLTASTTQACALPSGYASLNNDCNDNNDDVFPGATEVYNSVDDDCDGVIDENFSEKTFYIDNDDDGHGSRASSTVGITAPEGFIDNSSDCNDNNAKINPGVTEICNGVDDDCDASVDEGVKITYYFDGDKDGYGLTSKTALACSAPSAYVKLSGDCNDSNGAIHPGANEINDDIDNDCDGNIDENINEKVYYIDKDKDGFGWNATKIVAETAPSGYVLNNTDCNDDNNKVYPGAQELKDSIDNDCDGKIDEKFKDEDWSDFDENQVYKNHGQKVSAMAHYTNYLKKMGEITGREKGKIMSSLNKLKNNQK